MMIRRRDLGEKAFFCLPHPVSTVFSRLQFFWHLSPLSENLVKDTVKYHSMDLQATAEKTASQEIAGQQL